MQNIAKTAILVLVLGCFVGAGISSLFLLALGQANGAPQEAAGAAIACAFAVVPYVVLRATEILITTLKAK